MIITVKNIGFTSAKNLIVSIHADNANFSDFVSRFKKAQPIDDEISRLEQIVNRYIEIAKDYSQSDEAIDFPVPSSNAFDVYLKDNSEAVRYYNTYLYFMKNM
jgi:hypothetical protein